ncbi:MAG: Rad52/Rad22 family DNA repair protein [Cyanobacteria bacterium P01_D01_bin.115]
MVAANVAEFKKPEAPTKPAGIGDWSIKQIESALSREIPRSYLKYLEKKNKRTGEKTQIPYIPWNRANTILCKYAPGWQGRVVRTEQIGAELVLTYSITIPTSEGDVTREATGSESLDCGSYGETAANAESQAFRRAAARFGLGLYLYDK